MMKIKSFEGIKMKHNKIFLYNKSREGIRTKIKIVLIEIWSFFIKCYMDFCRPKIFDKKYNVAICAIFKNEADYLREWIEFHKIVGVEHFYLYDNKSDDNYRKILTPYIENGLVTLIDWPYERAQIPSYEHCIKHFSDEAKWIGFIDLDEFIVPIKDNNIYNFLMQFERNRSAVLIYWKMFGTSGRLNRDLSGLVTEDFVVSARKYRDIGKCFYNTAYKINSDFQKKNSVCHHFLWCKIGSVNIPPVNMFNHICYSGVRNIADSSDFPIQINHYFNKSLYEYMNRKSNKGNAYTGTYDIYNTDYFFAHEEMNGSVDYSAYKYLVKLKMAMDMNCIGE